MTVWRTLAVLSIAGAALTVSGSLGAYGYYYRLQASVHHEDPDTVLGKDRPKKLNKSVNVLLMGSDSRSGSNAKYGRGHQNEAPKADSVILVHLAAGGGRAYGVSIPRDLMVPIPSCPQKRGPATPPLSLAMFNSAFGRGGPTCTIKTVEKFTGIHIDHFVEVDFAGFKGLTEAVGGVPICLSKPVHDRRAGLDLPRGRSVVKGETALGFVRARYSLGDGTDTQRMKRQQQFMASFAHQAMSGGVLADPSRLNKLLTSGARSMTTDRALSLSEMLRLAQGMRGMSAGSLKFTTLPSAPWSQNRNRVAMTPAAAPFLAAIREDRDPMATLKPTTRPTVRPRKTRPASVRTPQGDEIRASDDICRKTWG
ncbi:LytR family transcriptional regulator [Actinomadura logoneensis]|uniref:LytR family transcriptional regulator n=1 Tax=Actinomadura logoneensis TaxID=2293572 RepID=A0A372JSE5_9ACTN|nr:LCP family protein [Actinomadura logoneensis]RFU42955.1 LytR family transcriptional regulator [Actinomadura logoneensis]